MALLKRAPNAFVAELEQHVELAAAKIWGVQLAAGFDRDRALAMYPRAMKRLSSVIGDQDPSLLGSLLRSRSSTMMPLSTFNPACAARGCTSFCLHELLVEVIHVHVKWREPVAELARAGADRLRQLVEHFGRCIAGGNSAGLSAAAPIQTPPCTMKWNNAQ